VAWKLLEGTPTESRHEKAYELVQMAALKYWLNAHTHPIHYPRAYLRQTLYTLHIDMGRRDRKVSSLSVDEFGEIINGKLISATNADARDTAEIVLEKLSFRDCLETIIPVLLETLSPGEFRAIVAQMKDVLDDVQALVVAFLRHGVDISSISWPTDKRALQSSRSLLCLAQKKMRLLKPSYAHLL
jgi:hypothetical protein